MSLPPPQTPPLTRERETDAPPTQTLTDPADLFTLLGRMVVCCVLVALTVALLLRRAVLPALFVGGISLIVQRMTIKLWRRLRDERIEKEAALLANQNGNESEGSTLQGNPLP